MAYIETPDGVPLYYNERGEGDPIVFINGWTIDADYWWQKNVDALADNHHVITYDPRGHGLSGKTDNSHTIPDYAEDLEFLVNSLDLEDMTLVGWSMGGAIIQTYLERFGDDRVRAIGFLEQLPYYYTDNDWEFGVFSEESLEELVGGLEANRAAAGRAFFEELFAEPPSEGHLSEIYAHTMLTPTPVATTILTDLVSRDLRSQLSEIKVPTLLLYAEQDAPGLGEWMHEQMPDSELVMFTESVYCPFWEEPEKFNTELAAFVSRVADRERKAAD